MNMTPPTPLSNLSTPLDLIRLPNDTKIHFCNAMHALLKHSDECTACLGYIEAGCEDLCPKGKDLIARELAYASTKIEFVYI